MNNFVINQQGKSHIYEKKPCEDAVSVSRAEDTFVLADGVSNSSMGGLGAKVRAEEMVKWLSNSSVRNTLACSSVSDIRKLVTTFLQKVDDRLCVMHSGTKPSDFASTLLAAVDVGTSLCLIHAGDGVIFGCPNTKQTSVTILSAPDNASNGAVYHSGHPEQLNRMRILRVGKEDYKKIVLATDGFSNAYFRYPFESNLDLLEHLLDAENEKEFERLYENDHAKISDDISCIIIEPGVGAYSDSLPNVIEKVPDETVPHRSAEPKNEVSVHAGPPLYKSKNVHTEKPRCPERKKESRNCSKTGKQGKTLRIIAAILVALLFAAEMTAIIVLAKKTEELEKDIASVKSQIVEVISSRRGTPHGLKNIETDS